MPTALQVFESVLRLAASIIPGALAAAMKRKTDEEAIGEALAAARAVKPNTGPGGAWTAHDEEQDERIRAEGDGGQDG